LARLSPRVGIKRDIKKSDIKYERVAAGPAYSGRSSLFRGAA
jgi:hypothetical protein